MNFIKTYDIFDENFCSGIVKRYQEEGESFSEKKDYNLNSGVKEWHFSNLDNWSDILETLRPKVDECIDDYLGYSNLLNKHSFYFSHASLMHQKEGHNVAFHYDSELEYMNKEEFIRNFAVLVYLNDNFEHGELVFPLQEKSIVPKAGTVAIFPTSFMYPHVTNPTMGDDRYVVRMSYFFDKSAIISRNERGD